MITAARRLQASRLWPGQWTRAGQNPAYRLTRHYFFDFFTKMDLAAAETGAHSEEIRPVLPACK